MRSAKARKEASTQARQGESFLSRGSPNIPRCDCRCDLPDGSVFTWHARDGCPIGWCVGRQMYATKIVVEIEIFRVTYGQAVGLGRACGPKRWEVRLVQVVSMITTQVAIIGPDLMGWQLQMYQLSMY